MSVIIAANPKIKKMNRLLVFFRVTLNCTQPLRKIDNKQDF